MISAAATRAEIDLSAIKRNIAAIKKRVAPARVMAVVKANAYGHGLKKITGAALEQEVDYLGVARLEEGIQIREFESSRPVLVFGGFFESEIKDFLEKNLELTLFDAGLAQALSESARELKVKARVHIKVDTGMGRVGVPWTEAVRFVLNVAELRHIDVVGIYTHFASSDAVDKSYAHTQLWRFRQVLTDLQDNGLNIPLIHAANSGAILDLPDSYFDLVRAGVSLYGYYPSACVSKSLQLHPAMSIKSRVIVKKEVEAGSGISYDSTYRTKEKTQIAVVPIGYGDGYNRLLSNQGHVLIRGRRFPVVGRVCMDHIMIDVGLENEVQIGDEVVLMGNQGDKTITIYEICEKLKTIPYEFTSLITNRVPRVYLN